MLKLMMGLKLFLLFVFCIGVKGQGDGSSRCMEMANYTGGFPSFVKTAFAEELNLTCINGRRSFDCLNEVTRVKFGHDMKHMATLLKGTVSGNTFQLYTNVMKFTEELCTEGTQFHNDYMMDLPCFRNLNNKTIDQCKKEAQAASVIFRHMDREESFDQSVEEPCVIAAYELGCIGADILEDCGSHAFNTYKEGLKMIDYFKIGICPTDMIQTVNTTIVDTLEKSESRRSVYHTILS